MLSVYYKVWVDAIATAQQKNGKSGNWKLLTLIPISILQGINFLTILLLIRALTHSTLVLFPVHIFNVVPLNVFLSVLITLFIPFMLLNYLLIFSTNQYDRLMKVYRNKGGKLYMRYIFITTGIIIIPIVLKFIF